MTIKNAFLLHTHLNLDLNVCFDVNHNDRDDDGKR